MTQMFRSKVAEHLNTIYQMFPDVYEELRDIDYVVSELEDDLGRSQNRELQLEDEIIELQDEIDEIEGVNCETERLEQALEWTCNELGKRSFENPKNDYDKRTKQQWKEGALVLGWTE